MVKGNLKNSPVITIHISEADKQFLQSQADKVGLQLAPYCRMILLNLRKEG